MAKVDKSAVVRKPTEKEKADIEATAKEMLKKSGEKEMYGTADGNLWTENNKQYAVDHAYKTKQELITIKAD